MGNFPVDYKLRMIAARAYDLHVEQLFDKMHRIHAALRAAGIPYRLVGGFGVFLQVYHASPEHARMTPNLDVVVLRSDMSRAIEAGAGLITPEIEATLSEPLGERLKEVRATR